MLTYVILGSSILIFGGMGVGIFLWIMAVLENLELRITELERKVFSMRH